MSAIVGIDAEILFVSTTTLAAETTGAVTGVTINSGGSGYSVSDVLTITGGGGTGATLTVTSVSTGAVTGVTITTYGEDYTVGTGYATTVAPPGGTGCTIDVDTVDPIVLPTWSAGPQTWDLSVNGNNYSWTQVSERNEIAINIAVDVAEHKVFVTNIDNAWVEKARLYMDWSGSLSGYYDDASNDIFDTMKAGVDVWFYIVNSKTDTSKYWFGKGLLTSVDHTIANEDFATLDADFEGNGPLYRSKLHYEP